MLTFGSIFGQNPEIAETYTEHSCQVNVAKYSPSGFYIASADVSGKVRIWDTVNKEHILKIEIQPLSGPIKDLAWSPDRYHPPSRCFSLENKKLQFPARSVRQSDAGLVASRLLCPNKLTSH